MDKLSRVDGSASHVCVAGISNHQKERLMTLDDEEMIAKLEETLELQEALFVTQKGTYHRGIINGLRLALATLRGDQFLPLPTNEE